MDRKQSKNWLLIWGCWTFVALFFTSESLLRRPGDYPISATGLLVRELLSAYLWCGLTPVIVRLSRRVRVEGKKWWGGLVFHIFISVIISLFHFAAYIFVLHITGLALIPNTYFQRLQNQVTIYFHFNLICYWAVFGVNYTIDYYRKYRERDLLASQLETRLAQSQLQSLKMQLHPHFLFNTLNTISVLMEKDVKAANRMLVNLSDLLRITLDDIRTQEVPLKQELDFLQRYLKIEEIRFRERLTVKINIEPDTLDAQVPNFILQPLVENAIRHGISPQIKGGLIEIGAKRLSQILHLFVRDTGAGVEPKDPQLIKEGIGLSNTRARLKQLYNDNHTFQISSEVGSGFLVHITIPFRTDGTARGAHKG